MRKFDHNGLLIAEYQGKLFEKSTELKCSSGVFIRRFLHSDLLKKLDTNYPSAVSLDPSEGISNIIEQFGDTDYGREKYSGSTMFWMGYMYRYISYTREVPTRLIMKLFPYKQMNNLFYTFHTQDPEWCVQTLTEMNHLPENVFDNNYRLKEAIKERKYYETYLSNLN